MYSIPNAESRVQSVPMRSILPTRYAIAGATLALLGISTILPSINTLWVMWTTDALKSIGMVVPLVSIILILRAWKSLGWRAEGTWWGLPLILAAIAGAWIEGKGCLVLVLSPETARILPPAALVVLAYGIGVVLTLGGTRLFRAALFPISLLCLVNPVPHAFSFWVDLPLQRFSAFVAREFALHLGQTLTPDRLRLMFTPDFGMFIAPGCNGIRGSVTMGLIALVAGYVYRFRWSATVLVTAGGVLLGYVFNLARLCLLVIYYLIALHLPFLQNKAEQADYCIGAALFLLATLLMFGVIHRLGNRTATSANVDPLWSEGDSREKYRKWQRLAVLAIVVTVGLFTSTTQTLAATHRSGSLRRDVEASFPERLGNYERERVWDEALPEGPIIYRWAEYRPVDGGTPIAIGVSPVADWHNPLICHSVRDETPVWQGQLMARGADGPVQFSSEFYNDGNAQQLEASTLCNGKACGEYATERTHFGFVFSFPSIRSAVVPEGQKSVRVLLRLETPDESVPNDVARQQLTGELRGFVSRADLPGLTLPYSRQ